MRGTRPLVKFIYISPCKPHCYAYKHTYWSKAHQKSYYIHIQLFTLYICVVFICFYRTNYP